MASEVRIVHGDKAVQRTPIIGTKMTVYTAWQYDPSSILESKYQTMTHFGFRRFGRIGSDGDDRADEAYQLICEAFPDAQFGEWDATMKEITVYG